MGPTGAAARDLIGETRDRLGGALDKWRGVRVDSRGGRSRLKECLGEEARNLGHEPGCEGSWVLVALRMPMRRSRPRGELATVVDAGIQRRVREGEPEANVFGAVGIGASCLGSRTAEQSIVVKARPDLAMGNGSASSGGRLLSEHDLSRRAHRSSDDPLLEHDRPLKGGHRFRR